MDEYFDTELAEIRLLKTGSNDSCHLTVGDLLAENSESLAAQGKYGITLMNFDY